MKKRHLLFPTIHAIACAMIMSLFIVGLTSAQSPIDLSKEILVYIQPSLLDFPLSERGFVVPERLNIRSDALRQAVRQFRVQVIGKAFPDFSDADTLRVLEDGRVISVPRFSRIFRFQFGQGNNIDSTISVLSKISGILFAEKNMDARLDLDDDYPLQWHLNNTGQLSGTPGEDIRAETAWSIFTGSSNIRIGVIDSGVELGHDDLTGKSSGDSYTTGSNFPTGTQNHGTHVAGIAAASHNNIGKVRGVDANARIESRRIFQADRVSLPSNPDGYVGDSEAAGKIISAVDAGSHILNNSWGGSSYSTTVRMAFAYAYKLNRTAVVAMGNNNSSVTEYPAGFGQGIIAVGATNNLGSRWYWNSYQGSNYGNHIDVAAPGDLIYSTITGNSYTRYTGTSMATPIASGIASLLKGFNPNLYNDDIEQIIKISADDKGDTGWDQYYGTGRVNAYKAFQFLQSPFQLSQLSAYGGTDYGSTDYYFTVIYGASGLSDGRYIVKRHEVRKTVSFTPMYDHYVWGRGVGTNGWSLESPNFSMGFCVLVPGTQTSNSATLRTYVYEIWTTLGQWKGWYPTNASNVSLNYTVLGKQLIAPVISTLVQSPTPIPPGVVGTVTAVLSQGNGNITFSWSYANKPTWVSVTFNGNTAYVSNDLGLLKSSGEQKIMLPPFSLTCTASNAAGSSTQTCYPSVSSLFKESFGNTDNEIITETRLDVNYPNPFNPSTIIKYQIKDNTPVTLKIYDIMGREVQTLVNSVQESGYYEIVFNAQNFSSGVYFYTLSTKDYVRSNKMILTK